MCFSTFWEDLFTRFLNNFCSDSCHNITRLDSVPNFFNLFKKCKIKFHYLESFYE